MGRKIISLRTHAGPNDYSVLVVLCDDGTLWEKSFTHPDGWKRFPEVPQGLRDQYDEANAPRKPPEETW